MAVLVASRNGGQVSRGDGVAGVDGAYAGASAPRRWRLAVVALAVRAAPVAGGAAGGVTCGCRGGDGDGGAGGVAAVVVPAVPALTVRPGLTARTPVSRGPMAATAAAAGPGVRAVPVERGVTQVVRAVLRVPRVVTVTAVPVAWRAVVVPVVRDRTVWLGLTARTRVSRGPMAAAAAAVVPGVAVAVVVLGVRAVV